MILALTILVQHLVLPAFFLGLLYARGASPRQWGSTAYLVASYILLILVIGGWAFVGYALRFVTALALIVVLVLSSRRARLAAAAGAVPAVRRGTRLFDVALGTLFLGLLGYALTGYAASDDGVDLIFPLRQGTYVVGQGGDAPIINHHNVVAPQRYALDILKLNAAGFRAGGLAPDALEAYAIYGDEVHSPCDGRIVWRRDGLPDLAPGNRDAELPEGNAVAIECGAVVVYLAHLQPGSIPVAEGDEVKAGVVVGRVGNSGNTTEPHLHMHAEQGPFALDRRGAPGVPMRFDGRFLVRNSLITP